jgi:hypothetical protein
MAKRLRLVYKNGKKLNIIFFSILKINVSHLGKRHMIQSNLGPLGTSATEWPIVPAPTPLCPLQIPLDQIRARTRAAAVGSQRPTA